MSQTTSSPSQKQHNQIEGTTVHGKLDFHPVQNFIETQIIQSFEAITQRELDKSSPYRGLKRFNFKDRDCFFGRDILINELLEAVNRSSLSLVLGASGSGKSSVVRAGLIPELKKSLGSQTFYDFIFTPDQDPFDSLYRCLRSDEKDYRFNQSQAKIALESRADTLPEVISTLKKDAERWLIFVDQFEELFTICDDPQKRKNFIEGLVQVANSGNSYVKIVLAMRSDFLEQFSFYRDLGAIANNNNIHLVTEMDEGELRRAIEQPAAKHGVVFEEGLVKQIIEEVEGQKGCLPLLQYTLNLLWESECQPGADNQLKIEDRTLNKESYVALKGVRGALQERVNEIYKDICEKNKDGEVVTKQIFLNLVNIVDTDSGSKAVSRRAYRDEFVGESVKKLLERFISENLLVSSIEYSSPEELQVSGRKQLKQSATIEIAHEILLSSWGELKRWLEQEKQAIILKHWLADATKQWQKMSKAADELWTGSRLIDAEKFRKDNTFKNVGGLSEQEEEFIDASVARRDRLLKQKERLLKIAVMASAVFAVLAIFTGIKWREAQIGQLNALSATSTSLLGSNQNFDDLDALINSIKAGKKLKQVFLPDAELSAQVRGTLQRVSYGVKERNRLEFPDEVVTASFSPDGSKLAAVEQTGIIFLWDKSGKQLAQFQGPQGYVESASFSPDSTKLVTVSVSPSPDGAIGSDSTVRLWDLESKKQIAQFKGHQGEVWSVSFSPNGSTIATGGDDGIRLWNLKGEQLPQFKGGQGRVIDVSFSHVGNEIATVLDDSVTLWDLNGKQIGQLKESRGKVRSVIFSPSEKQLLTTGSDSDRSARLWSLDGKQIAEFKEGPEFFSPDGSLLAGSGKDGIPRLWDLDGQEVAEFKGHQFGASSVIFSPDGKQLVTSGRDKTIRLWDLSSQYVAKFKDHRSIFKMIFSPDGSLLASEGISYENKNVDPVRFPMGIGRDNAVSIWDLQGKKLGEVPINRGNRGVLNMAISPDNQQLAIVQGNGIARLWDWKNKQKLEEFKEPQGSSIIGVSFSGDRTLLVTKGKDSTVHVSDWKGKQVAEFKDSQSQTYQVILSPDGSKIVTVGNEGLSLWNLDGKQVAHFNVTLDKSEKVILNRDGSLVAINREGVRQKESVRVLNWEGKQVAQFQGITGEGFSPDGHSLISTEGFYGTTRVWDIESQQLVAEFSGNGDFDAQFSPDSRLLVIVGNDDAPTLWRFETLDELMVRGCNWVQNYLQNNPKVDESDRHLCDGIGG